MRFVGTFDNYADADAHLLRADNFSVAQVWNDTYDEINRVNEIIQKVPDVPDLSAGEKSEILGEAYFLRALQYHNLVKLWDGVVAVPLSMASSTTSTKPSSSLSR